MRALNKLAKSANFNNLEYSEPDVWAQEDKMVFENLQVKHKSFGEGTVLSKNGNYITVSFGIGNKIFVYPDIFEKFLTLGDGTVSEEILADLHKTNDAKQQIIAQKHEENERARTRGIVIPGKEFNPNENEDEEAHLKNSEAEEV